MTKPMPEHLAGSNALQYVISKGWDWEDAGNGQIQIMRCPYCNKEEGKFYMAVSNDPSRASHDGLHQCFHGTCQSTGNLRSLQEKLGDRIPGVESKKEWAGKGERQPDPLPDVASCHKALLGDPDAMDYLLSIRGFSQEIIVKQQLGLKDKVFFRDAGECKAIVIPFLVDGNCVYAKYRTFAPKMKDFAAPYGWDVPLYNGEIVKPGTAELIFVEGEYDAISCISHGVSSAVGVPGSSFRKAAWIETLDGMPETKIYILYDNDKAGIKGAQELVSRIGHDRCYKIVLPLFNLPDGKPGKDVGEWFQHGGGTLEKFEELKQQAKLFDVPGATSSGDALDQLEDETRGKKDMAPSYVTQWPDLNKLVGFENGDVIDILAPEKVGKTTFAMNLIDHMVKTYDEDGLIVCLEMTQVRLATKWVSMVTGFEDNIVAPNTEEALKKKDDFLLAIAQAKEEQRRRKADLYFAYPQNYQDNPDTVFKLIRDCIRRYGVKWVVFDNLQKLADDTLKNQAHRTIHLSQLSKKFATLAKDTGVKLIRILQPKRIEKGSIISTNDVDGSSQTNKDCDAIITMWRSPVGEIKRSSWEKSEGVEDSDVSFDPLTRLNVGLTRYSAGGTCRVYFDGARSQVKAYDEALKAQLAVQQPQYNQIITQQVPVEPAAAPMALPTEGSVTI